MPSIEVAERCNLRNLTKSLVKGEKTTMAAGLVVVKEDKQGREGDGMWVVLVHLAGDSKDCDHSSSYITCPVASGTWECHTMSFGGAG